MIIKINNLKIKTIIGVNDEERNKLQEIGINLILTVPDESSCNSDNIKHTVNYDSLSKEIVDIINVSKYFLIERLGGEIQTILKLYPLVSKATIEVMKPGAVKAADYVSVILDYEK